MGKEGTVSSGKRSSSRQIGREGDCAAQQPKGVSRPSLPGGGRPAAGGHQLSLRHLRCQARDAHGSTNTQ